MRTALAFAVAAALACGASPALPQGDGVTVPAPGPEPEDARTALSREMARMRAEIAGIERLMRWQADLTRIARTDRAEALRQRLPMADCHASALVPICGDLTGLFRPEETDVDESVLKAPAAGEEGAP